MLNGLTSFWKHHVTGGGGDFTPAAKAVGAGLATGVTALTSYAGYRLGELHQAHDVVTHSTEFYPETVSRQDGFMMMPDGNGGFTLQPQYTNVQTGRWLARDVAHHSVFPPHTALGGAIGGALLGAGASALAGVALHALNQGSED